MALARFLFLLLLFVLKGHSTALGTTDATTASADLSNNHHQSTIHPSSGTEIVFVDSVYNFTTLNFPGKYPNLLVSHWQFSTYEGYRLLLRFHFLFTERYYDFVKVGNGNISNEQVVLTWSGGPAWSNVKVLSSGNTQWMTFHSDISVDGFGFAGSVEVVDMPPSALNCGDDFHCVSDAVCIPHVRVCDFSTNCASGSDEASCVGATNQPQPSTHWCHCNYWCTWYNECCNNCPGTTNQPVITTGWCHCNYWCVWFNECCNNCPGGTIQPEPITTLAPFDPRSEVVFVDSVYNFTSANFPEDYPNRLAARWYFSTYEGSQLLLKFHVLITEQDYDYVRVGNGNVTYRQVVLTWSGGPTNGQVQVLSSGNTQWMTFNTDSSVTRTGFAGSVEAVNMSLSALDCGDDFRCVSDGVCLPNSSVCDHEQDCASRADEESCVGATNQPGMTTRWCHCGFGCAWYNACCQNCPGTTAAPRTEAVFVDSIYNFTSENFPGNYPNNLLVRWRFSTFEGYQLLMTFYVLDTEGCCDHVLVGNGNVTFRQVALTWSGGPADSEVQVLSPGNTQWMTFYTDSSVTRTGFTGSVEAVNMNASVLDCGNNFKCESDGVCIPHSNVCNRETECASQSDEQNCNGVTNQPDITTSWCHCSYWCAWYNECCSHCPGGTVQPPPDFTTTASPHDEVVFVDSVYNFTSPNFPGDYPNDFFAQWHFFTFEGYQLLMKFHVLYTESCCDYVRVGNGNVTNSQVVLTWSEGRADGLVQVLSSGSSQWMTFDTDYSVTQMGFAVSVEAVRMSSDALVCGDDFKCVTDRVCIPQGSVCNYRATCASGSDEENCHASTTPRITTTNLDPGFSVRLVGGMEPYEGRVEVLYQNTWGTVCDDSWDLIDATVVCKQLGYRQAEQALSRAYFGEGSGPIWMDNVHCNGDETSLDQCPHNGFGSHDCNHREDAGVICEEPEELNPQDIILHCSPTSFQVDIPEGMVPHNHQDTGVYLAGDSSCEGFYNGGYYISLNSSLTGCGTQYFENNTHSFYQNKVVNSFSNASVIEYLSLEIPIVCQYERFKTLESHFVTINEAIIKQEKGLFEYDFAIYTDINYSARYYTYPVETTLMTELYFRAELTQSPRNLEIRLRSCRATPSTDFDDPNFYEVIRDGCGVGDVPVRVLTPHLPTQADFELTSFRFRRDLSNPDSEVWIHCEVIVCDVNDTSSECRHGCEQPRHRRSVGGTYQEPKRMVKGPILLRDARKESETVTSEENSRMFSIVTALLAVSLVMFIGLLVMGVTLHKVMQKLKQPGYQPLQQMPTTTD